MDQSSCDVGHKYVQKDPPLALFSGQDGLDLIREFCSKVSGFLSDEGLVSMEIGYDQAAEVEYILRANEFKHVKTLYDLSGVARFPFASNQINLDSALQSKS